jgi:ATP synthase protein I
MANLPEDRKLALAMAIGTTISSTIAGGVILGYLVDQWLGTAPWLSVVGLVVGSVGAFASILRLLKRLE